MPVNGLNHINIVTGDLARTVEFYESVLGMEAKPLPMATPAGFEGRWITDSQGQPIIHVQAHNPDRHGERQEGPTGTIDHIALTCADFAGTKARCEELGVDYRVNDRQFGDLRQVFLVDPNNINLELNFAGD
jgi:catechol 2,3-dioxygenase-like lactoylglutathione lyase family enzyme